MKTAYGKFINDDFFKLLSTYQDDLSYRRWNRLTREQQQQFEEYELYPEELNIALKVLHIMEKHYNSSSVSFAVNIMSLVDQHYLKWFQDNVYKHDWKTARQVSHSYKLRDDKYLEVELLFRKYKPLDSFKIRSGYAYVMTSRPINGKHYIHPQKMYSTFDLKKHERGIPYVWTFFEKIMLRMVTRVIYPEMDIYPSSLSQEQQAKLKKIANK